MDLFLFPHQDDEYFVAPFLQQRHARARCVFLTTGDFHGASGAVRNAESRRALRLLGVPEHRIDFAGDRLRVPDNGLAARLTEVFARLQSDHGRDLENVITPAWEGGHPDHDAACLLGHALAARSGGVPVREFAAYRAHPVVPYFYKVMKPLPGAAADGVRFTRENFGLFRCYPSQWRTWLGLFPPLLVNYLAGGRTGLYRAGRRDFGVRPHGGRLYYEYRGWNTFDRFLAQTEEFRRIHWPAP